LDNPIYLDYAATTPIANEVAAVTVQCLTMDGEFANSASLQHGFDERADFYIKRN